MELFKTVDNTQTAIVKELLKTEELLVKICKRLNGQECKVTLLALEDLGFSNNTTRMHGGFFTGMYAQWESKVPFIPVDATVNACGVSVYELKNRLDFEDFTEKIDEAKKWCAENSIVWNLDSGNHLVSLCQDTETGKQFLVLHASNNDYKYGGKGLYPREDVWYFDKIQTISNGERYIRYIHGDVAVKFYDIYCEAEKENPKRNRLFAEKIVGEHNILSEQYFPHYGMPTESSVAIGCQWLPGEVVLLSALNKNIYLIKTAQKFFPHGFGVNVYGDCNIHYKDHKLHLNGQSLNDHNFLSNERSRNRYANHEINVDFVRKYLDAREFEIKAELKQICSGSRHGIVKNYIKEN